MYRLSVHAASHDNQWHVLELVCTFFIGLQVDVVTEQGVFRASVPSGASTGHYEVINTVRYLQLAIRFIISVKTHAGMHATFAGR